MSEPKIVEAVGNGTVNLSRALGALSGKSDGSVRADITRVRVQKVRDGKVYEDVTLEAKHGFHG